MNTNLADIFVGSKPRETAGSRSANRFDYQKNWALCKLLSLHCDQEDYLLILDYHEDIVVFDSSTDPQVADFFQVKTKIPGNWTVNALVKDQSKKGTSIFGKLFSNQRLFKESVRSLVFISNKGLSVRLHDGTKGVDRKEIRFSDLCSVDKAKLCDCVHDSDMVFCDWNGINKFFARRTDLSVIDHVRHTTGRLADFLEKKCPTKRISATFAYKAISGEISRKTNSEESCTSMNQLRSRKGISRNTFSSMVEMLEQVNSQDTWSEIRSQLENENYKFSEIQKLKPQWMKYIVDRMDASNEELNFLREKIISQLSEMFSNGEPFSLRGLVRAIMPSLGSTKKNYYEKSYIQVAVMCEAMHYEKIPKAGQKSAEETA